MNRLYCDFFYSINSHLENKTTVAKKISEIGDRRRKVYSVSTINGIPVEAGERWSGKCLTARRYTGFNIIYIMRTWRRTDHTRCFARFPYLNRNNYEDHT